MVTSPKTFLGYYGKAIAQEREFARAPLILFSFPSQSVGGQGGWSLPITDITGTALAANPLKCDRGGSVVEVILRSARSQFPGSRDLSKSQLCCLTSEGISEQYALCPWMKA